MQKTNVRLAEARLQTTNTPKCTELLVGVRFIKFWERQTKERGVPGGRGQHGTVDGSLSQYVSNSLHSESKIPRCHQNSCCQRSKDGEPTSRRSGTKTGM